MNEDIIIIINEIGRNGGMLNEIQLQNMYHKSTLSDLFAEQIGHDDDDSCASNNDWKYIDKTKHEENEIFRSDINIGDNELEDTNDTDE